MPRPIRYSKSNFVTMIRKGSTGPVTWSFDSIGFSRLAADEIVLSPHAVLGPIDPQLEQSPAASVIKVVEEKPIAEIDDKTLILADVGRKAISQVKDAARRLLVRHLAAEQAEALAQKLASGTWTHDYPISAEEARELGLPVSTEIPDRVLELMALYPQPVHTQQGGVEYLPVPRQKESTPMPL